MNVGGSCGSCEALLKFAHEQLAASRFTTANVSQIVDETRQQNAALVVCVHGGHVYYQLAGRRHVVHGDRERTWQALNMVYQAVRSTGPWPRGAPPKCFQQSLRDDQRQNILGWGDGWGLPALLWHYERYEEASATPPNERPVSGLEPRREGAAWEAVARRPRLLWPEHPYLGELVRGLPPTPTFRRAMARRWRPWQGRRDRMRYRGSSIGLTRSHLLACARRPHNLSALGARGEAAASFFTNVADFGRIAWVSNGTLLGASRRAEEGGEARSEARTEARTEAGVELERGAGEEDGQCEHGGGERGARGEDHRGREQAAPPGKPDERKGAHGTGGLGACGLGAFGVYKHALWLPGGADWSSALNRIMHTGAALYMPSDLAASHSLNTLLLLERCDRCAVGFRRLGDYAYGGGALGHAGISSSSAVPYAAVDAALRKAFYAPHVSSSPCVALAEAFAAAEAEAEAYAARLVAFADRELCESCVLRYMRVLIEGLPQRVVHIEAALANFRNFSCAHSRGWAEWLTKHGAPAALQRFDAWYDAEDECTLRATPPAV